MSKRFLSIALCLCMVLTLLPTAALATDRGTADSIEAGLATEGLAIGDTFTVGGVTYTYGGVVSSTDLDLSSTVPTGNTVWKAEDGYVLFTPAADSGNPTLTLNDATTGDITLKGAYTLALEGANSTDIILVKTVVEVVGNTNPLTITAAGGATLTASQIIAGSVTGDTSALNAAASTDDGIKFYGTLTIIGGGDVSSIVVDGGAAVTVQNTYLNPVEFSASTGFTNNGTITIVPGQTLDLTACTAVASGSTGSIVNNGILGLPATFSVANLNTLNITGNGTVTIDNVAYSEYDGDWVQDVTATGLDLTSTAPEGVTTYKAGTGTIVFTPAAGEGGTPTLTLNSVAIATPYEPTKGTIKLQGAYTLAMKGVNKTGNITVMSGSDPAPLTITADADSALSAASITASPIVVAEGAAVTVSTENIYPVFTADAGFTNKGTLIINTTKMIVTTSGGFTNEGTINIVNGKMLDLSGCNAVTNTGTIVNNGTLSLPATFSVADLDTLNITGNGVVTIGGVDYAKLNGQWVQDVSNNGFVLTSTPTDETVYKAGTGTVTFTPATTEANAKLVFDGATIFVANNTATAVTLPGAAVDVSFRGTNSISGFSSKSGGVGKAFSATAAVTFTLEEGSTTTLTATGYTAKVISSTGSVTIDGSGALNLKPMMNPFGSVSDGYAIYTTGNVTINGGTVCEQRVASDNATNSKFGVGGIEAGTVTLGAVTIPAGGTLDLHDATSAEFSTDDPVINNGTLILPDDTEWNDVPTSIGGVVVVDGNHQKAVGEAWAQDVTATGLDISTRPGTETVYTAGEGTITFTPATTDPVAPATLTLNNATIASTSSGAALVLGGDPINLVLEGSSSLKGFGNMAMGGSNTGDACGDITISGTGSLKLSGSYNSYGSFRVGSLTLTDTATVTSNGGTVNGDVTVGDATLNAVLKVKEKCTVYGKHTIAVSEQKDNTGSVLEWEDDASMEVNGLLTLAKNTLVGDIENHITGSGIVRIVTESDFTGPKAWDAYYTDGTPVPNRTEALNFTLNETGGRWKSGATLEEDGYTFTGNAQTGYVLTLGNLLIVYADSAGAAAIQLPMDGKVEVKLVGDTRVYCSGGFAMLFGSSVKSPCTISGSGSLLMVHDTGKAALNASQPLTISGGNITLICTSGTSNGVVADNGLTITGGTITVSCKNDAFTTAPKFSGYTPVVTYGADADAATTTYLPDETVYTASKYVRITKHVPDCRTLTFEVNGGSEVAEVTMAKGIEIDLSAYAPTREGYTFVGWYADAELTMRVISVTLTKNTTVYAKWSDGTLPFADVPENAYYRDAVLWAVENGITEGTGVATFSPDGLCTRAQAVTFLWRASGSPAPKTEVMPFNDVPIGSYYYNAVLWAVEQGITNGTDEDTFSPDGYCSRAQIVAMLWRTEGSRPATAVNPFADVSTGVYYTDAVLWAVDEGITEGTSATTFSPDDHCTRAQIVTFLYRAMK